MLICVRACLCQLIRNYGITRKTAHDVTTIVIIKIGRCHCIVLKPHNSLQHSKQAIMNAFDSDWTHLQG